MYVYFILAVFYEIIVRLYLFVKNVKRMTPQPKSEAWLP